MRVVEAAELIAADLFKGADQNRYRHHLRRRRASSGRAPGDSAALPSSVTRRPCSTSRPKAASNSGRSFACSACFNWARVASADLCQSARDHALDAQEGVLLFVHFVHAVRHGDRIVLAL